MKKINITGQVFGKLTVIRKHTNAEPESGWLCSCQCGNSKSYTYSALISGKIKSCGCIKKQKNKVGINIYKATGIMSCSRERVRELIRIRDNHICQICGKKWIEGMRRFDVHHLDCKKEKTKQCDDYHKEKDNMITLCHKCHLNLPEHKLSMRLGSLGKTFNK